MILKKLCAILTMTSFIMANAQIDIRPIESQDIENACAIIYNVVLELQIIPSDNLEEVIQKIEQTNALRDMDTITTIDQTYMCNKGIFLVVFKDNILAGFAGIKNLGDNNCELTRMFFAPEYRGQGLGSQLIQQLFLYARAFSYKKMRLNIWNPITQVRAIDFYKKLDFYEIDPYKMGQGKLFMEKIL